MVDGIIRKSNCEIINEAEEILKGADKLSEQLNKSEWAKMPKKKQEATVKEYEAAQDIMGVPAEEIKVVKQSSGIKSFQFYEHIKTLIINPQYIEGLLSKGIIREKKSANEELAERICVEYWESTSDNYRSQRLYTVILEELEKAGVK